MMMTLTITMELETACDPQEVIKELRELGTFNHLAALVITAENAVDDELDMGVIKKILVSGTTTNPEYEAYHTERVYRER